MTRRNLVTIGATGLAGIAVSGSFMAHSPAWAQDPVRLTVSAASDLTPAFNEIGPLFEQQTGNIVDFNFGSTGQLAQQIAAGAPVDVFAAANVSFIEELDAEGLLLSDTVQLYARGRIVLWTRNDSPLTIDSLDDLISDEVRTIAIANPDHAPYGAAARDAMQSAGVWEAVQPKLVLGENISDTMQFAVTGNVDVGIVALSLAVQSDGIWTLVPDELYPPLDQALAVVKGTAHEEQARAFAAFVNSPEGRAIMDSYGFLLPTTEAAPDASPAAPVSTPTG